MNSQLAMKRDLVQTTDLAIEIVLLPDEVTSEEVWERLARTHPGVVSDSEVNHLYKQGVELSLVTETLEGGGYQHFDVQFDNAILRHATLPAHDLSYIQLEECVSSFEDAARWIAPFLQSRSFVQARLYHRDDEYAGERVLRRGHIEAIGEVMWLGPRFWRLAGSKRRDLATIKWLTYGPVKGDIIKVEAPVDLMDDDIRMEGNRAVELKEALFPLSKEA